jgi:hypothetical protein
MKVIYTQLQLNFTFSINKLAIVLLDWGSQSLNKKNKQNMKDCNQKLRLSYHFFRINKF